MIKQRHAFLLSILLCIALALIPPVTLLLVDSSTTVVMLAVIGCFGWLYAGILLFKEGLILDAVNQSMQVLGLQSDRKSSQKSIDETVEEFLRQSTKYHKAAYGFLGGDSPENNSLSENLNKVISLTYEELSAQSVELSLFDEQSGLSAQSMLLGDPISKKSQWMLMEEDARSGSRTTVDEQTQESTVVSTPVRFSGRTFGMLRVEFPGIRELTDSDQQILQLLAAQGALLLVDAQFTEELLRLRQIGDESFRAKTGFLANLSHELRGPLGVILNGAELSLDGLCGELTPALRDSLTMIKESGEHLLDLVNDVLDFAKIEAGKVQVQPVTLPLRGLLEDLVAVVRSQAVQKNLTLRLDALEDSWAVRCDKRHARQMLINFLTNAVKYTPEGGSIRVYAEQQGVHNLRICIQDSGIGIPESEQHKVFGAFERVEDAYAQSQCGTGLGMPLTARLAEVNKGKVGFVSTQGEGSTFWLNLPFEQLDSSYLAADDDNEAHEASIQGRGERILLVDPDESSRQMLQTYLDDRGFVTIGVSTGPEMMKALRNEEIAIAVVENDIPNLPGENMVGMIRAIPQGAAIPLILLSAKAFVFDIEQFLKLGVDRCLSKPVSLAELAFTLRLLLDQAQDYQQSLSQSQ